MIKRSSDLPELAPLGEIAEAADGANVHVNATVGVVEAVVDRKDQHAAPEKPDRIRIHRGMGATEDSSSPS